MNVWVGLLDVLAIVSHHEVVVLVMTTPTVSTMMAVTASATATHVATLTTALVIVG